MKIYIIRHGETDSNKEGRFQGWSDDPLNEYGILLAEQTGRAMHEEGLHFDAAFSSPLQRASKTAQIVLRECGDNCPVWLDERIQEICLGDWEKKRLAPEYGEVDPDVVKTFMTHPDTEMPVPGGESLRQVMVRTQAFLKELAQHAGGGENGTRWENVLVATHGGALRCMLNFLYEDPKDFWHGSIPLNCCVNVVEAVPKGSGTEDPAGAPETALRLVEDDRIFYDPDLCVDRYKV